MVEEIIFIYSFCSDLLKEIGFVDDGQCKMTSAEIMTVAIISALYFRGNHERKYIETTFSRIVGLFPRSIVAVTKERFLIKILLFVVAYVFLIAFRNKALAKNC
jgi:hypothetical protein